MNDLRAQLAPGWSGVNIALTVVLFLLAWPLGLLMIGYIVWGRGLGLDFSRPETLSTFGSRLARAWRAGTESWRRGPTLASGTGTPDARAAGGERPPVDGSATDETLRRERETLARERQAFETEKREWREGSGRQRREPLGREPLDS